MLKSLTKSVWMPLGLTVATSVRGAAIHRKIFPSGTCPLDLAKRATLIIFNEEMNHVMKIVKYPEESSLLI